ncbi:MAG: sulfatase-like hydrolase/transferase [Betaproteobacteria bacterium]
MSKPPNFLLFVTDQHRADHLGCYGSRILSTPGIDRIAAESCVFENFHVATPLCQPNRASLMTSRMPSVHGVQMNGRELSFGELTFVDMLRESGYRTALVGKAHLQNITEIPAAWPAPGEPRHKHESNRRFPGIYGQELWTRWDRDPEFDLALPYYGFENVKLTVGHSDEQYGHWRRWLREQTNDAEQLIGPANAIPTPEFRLFDSRQAWRTRVPEDLYPTRYIADRCCDLLADYANGQKPFFMQCSFPDPHHPYTPPGRYWDLYKPEDIDLPGSFGATLHDAPPPIAALRAAATAGMARKSGHGSFSASEREVREAIALNYGNIACIDDALSRVHARLRQLGLDDNTVIMFTSDHGDLLGDRGLMLKGGLHYRSLTRVPFIWRDTRDRRKGRRSNALAQTIDIASTVLERAGLDPANGMQGRSLLSQTAGTAGPVRSNIVIEEEGQRRDFGLAHRLRIRSLVTEHYRLSIYAEEAWGELYDLVADPLELRNLWNQPSAGSIRAELTEALALSMLNLAESSPYPQFSA